MAQFVQLLLSLRPELVFDLDGRQDLDVDHASLLVVGLVVEFDELQVHGHLVLRVRDAFELHVLQVDADSTLVVVEVLVRHLVVVLVEDAFHDVLAVQDPWLRLLALIFCCG